MLTLSELNKFSHKEVFAGGISSLPILWEKDKNQRAKWKAIAWRAFKGQKGNKWQIRYTFNLNASDKSIVVGGKVLTDMEAVKDLVRASELVYGHYSIDNAEDDNGKI